MNEAIENSKQLSDDLQEIIASLDAMLGGERQ